MIIFERVLPGEKWDAVQYPNTRRNHPANSSDGDLIHSPLREAATATAENQHQRKLARLSRTMVFVAWLAPGQPPTFTLTRTKHFCLLPVYGTSLAVV